MRKVVFILLTILLSATYIAKADNNDFTKHWTPITGTQYHMSVYCIITINGEEQFSDALEIGAFCGDECRGSSMAQLFPPTSQYVVPLSVVSNQESGETISEILIVNSLGAEVMHKTGMTGKVVKGLPVSGVYSIQVITNTGNVYRGKLVVK